MTEEIQDEVSFPIDDPTMANVDEKHSVVSDDEFGTSLTRFVCCFFCLKHLELKNSFTLVSGIYVA